MTQRLDALRQDLAFALRQLRRAPGFTLGVVASFALGIGANATMFGIIDRLLFQPVAHLVAPERVFTVGEMRHYAGDEYRTTSMSYPAYKDYRDHVSAFEAVGVSTWPNDMPLGRGEHARKIKGMLVSASYLALTGARPALGRFVLPEEDREPDGAPVVVISYGFWRREFGGERRALGSTLDIGPRRYTIVGVAPKRFTGLQRAPVDVFIPITAAEGLRFGGPQWATTRNSIWLQVTARLRPGATPALAEVQATTMLRGVEATRSRPDSAVRVSLGSLMGGATTQESAEVRVSKLLAGVSLAVLLIACANVANLLLARALRRRREIAVRLALGIGRGRLVGQLVAESVLLGLLGGAAALLVVRWGGALVRTTLLADYAWEDSGVDARVLAFTAAAALLSGLLAGLAPALQGSSPDLTRALKEGSREGSVQRSRTRTVLMLAQAALAVVLLVGTGLFVRSLRNVNAVDVGMQTSRVLVATMDLHGAGFTPERAQSTFLAMRDRVARMPGVAGASVGGALPFSSSYAMLFRIPGRDSLPQVKDGGPYVNAVTPEFFATLGTRILRGRGFTAADAASGARVIVISESMARLYWPGADPVGRCVVVEADSLPCSEVIGVAENTHRNGIVEEGEILQYYVQLTHAPAFMKERVLFVRPAAGAPERWVDPVRRALQTTEPDLPFADVRVMRTLLDHEVRPWRLGATMFGVFGALALVLTALGLYSVIAFAVVQRTHEMGIRVALGAGRASIVRLVVRQGVVAALVGSVIGVAVAAGAARFVASLLFHESPRDPAVFVSVGAVLLAVAVLASAVPAWRASRVDPMVALRAD